MSSTTFSSAQFWGRLWGAMPRDWAVAEELQMPTYETAIGHLGIGSGQRVLDLGCGTGVFLRAAADRGAQVVGLDAADGLLEIARERVPEADLHIGDMQDLPFGDDSFDVVTGFSSLFFADDVTRALLADLARRHLGVRLCRVRDVDGRACVYRRDGGGPVCSCADVNARLE